MAPFDANRLKAYGYKISGVWLTFDSACDYTCV